jgi:hypothetical protein
MKNDQAWELAKWTNQDWNADAEYYAPWHSDSTPIIIGGCPRSGSTLLRFLLACHTATIDGPETHLFLPLSIDETRLAARFQMNSTEIKAIRNRTNCRAAFIDSFQDLLLAQSGAQRWVEKTSRNVHVFEWIRDRFPRATLLHIIRDPRDVIASLRTHPRFLRGRVDRFPTNWQHPWSQCIDRWRRCVQDGIKLRGYDNYLEVKYERLVSDLETTLRAICFHSNLPFESEMLNPKTRSARITETQRAFVINNLEAAEAITRQSIGRWQRDLPVSVLRKIETTLNDLMSVTGYS